MSEFGVWTLGLGCFLVGVYGYMVVNPAKAYKMLKSFPRNQWLGRILATIGLLWAAWLVYNMPMGRFDYLKKFLFIATPVVIGGVFVYMEDLLAPRALGGLLLLYPAPVLALARLSNSNLSLIMTVVCYLMVVKGMVLVLYPWAFRKSCERIFNTENQCRLFGVMGSLFGLGLIALSIFVY